MTTPDNDRETLCALFDGELQGDAARFGLKRLSHDAQWRQACGRWQLYGDVMRGQAAAVAGSSFADRVALAIAQEPVLATVASTATPSSRRPSQVGSRRGWIGGALAASVAVAALFVTRPFSNDAAPAPGEGTAQVAVATAAPPAPTSAASNPAAPVPADPAPLMPDAPDHQAGLGAAAVAAVEVPRRAAERRSTRSQSQRAALRASRQAPAPITAVASAAPAATTVAIAASAGSDAVAAKPFQPQHPEIAARPWPRAVLPQYSGSSGLTASYGSTASSPSFYPFEPSLAPVADPAGAEAESSVPNR
ncbi:MAG TPA: sigma-E factor negative regulatory protein [Lysobacter sp.]